MAPLPHALGCVAAVVLAAHCTAQRNPDPIDPGKLDIPKLTQANRDAWSQTIRPRRVELSYDGIPWHSRLAEGFLAANQAQKPVLLWVMNGHPLGCT